MCERYDKLLEMREGRGEYLPRLWTDKPVKKGKENPNKKRESKESGVTSIGSHRK